jgi:hypothetical protein
MCHFPIDNTKVYDVRCWPCACKHLYLVHSSSARSTAGHRTNRYIYWITDSKLAEREIRDPWLHPVLCSSSSCAWKNQCRNFSVIVHGQQLDSTGKCYTSITSSPGFLTPSSGWSRFQVSSAWTRIGLDVLRPVHQQAALLRLQDAGFTDAELNSNVRPPHDNPAFDLHIGVNRWTTVNVTTAGDRCILEAVVVSPADFFQVSVSDVCMCVPDLWSQPSYALPTRISLQTLLHDESVHIKVYKNIPLWPDTEGFKIW